MVKIVILPLLALALASCGEFGNNISHKVDQQLKPKDALTRPVRLSSDRGSVKENQLAALMRGHQKQARKSLVYDSRLNRVARRHAQDMGQRKYFGHINPEGNGPNVRVLSEGYRLPVRWTGFRRQNHVESVLGGPDTAHEAFAAFLNSSPHRGHILARNFFHVPHTRYGIGHAYVAGSPMLHYWVVLTAPPEK